MGEGVNKTLRGTEVKLHIARSQLGTALGLFLRDRDPLSVHALACGGSEVIEGLAEHNNLPTLSTHILETHPDFNVSEIRKLRNKHWNAIKHFYRHDQKTARDDESLMENFSDEANDVVLFSGWLDYMNLTKKLPVEVQVFQVWWYATNEVRMNPNSDPTPFRTLFPNIVDCNRSERKRRLRRAVEKYRKDTEILNDPRTEVGPLMYRA